MASEILRPENDMIPFFFALKSVLIIANEYLLMSIVSVLVYLMSFE